MPTWLTGTIGKYLGIAAAIVALIFSAYLKGRHDVNVEFDAFKADVAQKGKEQEAHNQDIIAQREQLNKGVIDGYKAKLSAADSYINGLRYDSHGGHLSTPTQSTSGTDGNTAYVVPPTPILAADCAKTTVMLLQLQQYEDAQEQIK